MEVVAVLEIKKTPVWGSFLLPGHLELTMVVSAISEVEVDQGLIWNAFGLCQSLEVVNSAAIDVDGDLLLQTACVGVFSGV
jgi:hypothetical protein